jgi:DNA repair exonuclease SbcCD ATPase subunit
MIIFKSIEWKNFLSTGNSPNKVLLNRSASTLIVGKNGDGKSTILDALCFALFGKPFRNINKGQLINSINQKQCSVTVEFSIGSNEYVINRGIKPNIFEIFHNGNLINQDAASKDYQKVLEQQILKLNYKTFTQVVILGSASFVPFMQLPSGQRRDVIEDILDIRIFSTMNQLLKEKIQATKEELSNVESQIQISKSAVESQQKIISSLVTSKKEHVESIRSRIESNEIEIRNTTATLEELSNRAKALRESITDKQTISEQISSFKETLVKVNQKVSDLNEKVAFFSSNDQCPSCAQNIPHDHKEHIGDVLTKDLECNKIEKDTIKNKLETLGNRLKEIDDVVNSVTELNIEISTFNSSVSTLNSQNTKLLQEIENAKSNTESIDAEKLKLKELAKSAMQHLDRKTVLSEERTVQEISATLLKDTGIKTAVIKEYLPAMNKLINMYLQAMDFYVHFELDESFNETIKSRFRDEFTYASFSEGEKMRIDLAILFTWRQIAKMKNSVNTNLLILDEIFDSSLDTAGTDYFLSVMNQLGEKTNVFVISHKGDQLFDKFHSVIKFEKKNDFSVMASP